MKYTKSFLWSLLALGALTACGEKDDPTPSGGDGVELGIRTNVTLYTNAPLVKDLTDGHEMNVWVSVASELGAEISSENLHAVNRAGTWSFDKPVKLQKGQTAEVVAVYPFSSANTDPKSVAVNIADQVDYLYSGKGAYASYTSNIVTLNMKHALSMLTVNIKKEASYTDAGEITNIAIEQPSLIATKGTLNAYTGVVTPTEHGKLDVSVHAQIGANGVEGALPSLWVAPFSSKDQTPVKATITIDGKDYVVDLPEVMMNTGWQYIFQAVLTANGLSFIPDATQEYALNKADDEIGTLEGHGVIVFGFTGSKFVYPAFTGDNIYGSIKAADGAAANYKVGGSLDLKSSARQEVTVETWNTTGFSIANIEGIDEINLSNY